MYLQKISFYLAHMLIRLLFSLQQAPFSLRRYFCIITFSEISITNFRTTIFILTNLNMQTFWSSLLWPLMRIRITHVYQLFFLYFWKFSNWIFFVWFSNRFWIIFSREFFFLKYILFEKKNNTNTPYRAPSFLQFSKICIFYIFYCLHGFYILYGCTIFIDHSLLHIFGFIWSDC